MENTSPMRRLWRLAAEEHGRLRAAIALAAIGVLAGMVPYWAAAEMITALLSRTAAEPRVYLWLCLAACAGYVLRSILYAEALALSHRAAFATLRGIRTRVLEKLPKLPLGAVIDQASGGMKHTIVDQVESMERTIAHLWPEMTANTFGPLCIFVYLLTLDRRMALLSLISIPVGMVFMAIIMRDYEEKYAGAVRMTNEMNAAIVEYIGGIEVIKAFNQGAASYEKFSEKVFANACYYYHWMLHCQLPMSVGKVVAPTTLITILPVGWMLYQDGTLPMGVFIQTIILSLGVAGPLLASLSFIDELAKVGTTVDAVEDFLSAEEQRHASDMVSITGTEIDVEHVSFAYDGKSNVLNDISLTIPSGTLNAFVGASGSGKSTLARLIAGYWDVTSGEIRIGGHDLKDIPLTQLYDMVSFVAQDTYLFDDTIRENIRLGRTSATDAEVERAAELAGCAEFIRQLECGYETIVGSGGSHLSGGERQRIAIARAMLKDAPIVILDEATAYIDPENEAMIQRAVSRLIAGKTVIVIAHRLSTITDADTIFLIADGTVEAKGTHAQLLDGCASYRAMWQAHMSAKDGEIK
ncbi:ABC transporter ATP-binding protein [Selenomonas sp. TAMA-11512]|uniref:ABC transporter ATP-binding protein n=1 Tax=Selenomonas sp. TAMA-11512 TaxID=3095337 RepID=UPI0030860A7E|nr:ABC transporter ATP-binding protein [Selenomonas sp. TAMA-11512]